MKWVAPYRRYVALRREEDFELALSAAPEPVAKLIRICLLSDRDHVEQAREELIATLPGGEEGEEGMTVRLASLDPFVELCESFPASKQDRWKEMLNMGIAAAKEAIELSSRLADDPCVAFYSSVLSTGYRHADLDEQALPPQLRALGIYKRLAETEPSLYRPEIASTLSNLAITWSDLRRLPASRDAGEGALVIYRELIEHDSGHKDAFCSTLNNLGATLIELREFSAAREAYTEALPICRELALQDPDQHLLDVATVLDNLGTVLREVRELDAALDALQESISIYRKLAAGAPAVYLPEVATTLMNLGNCLADRRDLTAARDAFLEALTIQRDLAAQDPIRYRPYLANTLSNFAGTLGGLRELTAAKEAYQQSLAIYQELSAAERHIYRPDVGMVLNNLGTTLHELRELNAAHDSLQEALVIRRDLSQAEPGVHSGDVATTLSNLACVLRELQKFQPAREAFEETLGIWRELAAAEPGAYRYDVAMTLMNLEGILMELRELTAARTAILDSLHILRELHAKQPEAYANDLAKAINNLGILLERLGEGNAALAAHEEALEIRQALANVEPAVYLPQLAQTLTSLGNALNHMRRFAVAQDYHRRAAEIYRQLAERQPDIYHYDVATSLINLGVALRGGREIEGAQAVFAEALATLKQLASEQPAYQNTLATALNNYGTALRDHGDLPGAREAYRQAHSVYRSGSHWVNAALPVANLGRVEIQEGDLTLAASHFEDALANLRQGLSQLTSPDHHDIFKAELEDVAVGLIQIYSRGPESETTSSRLAGLFESLRRHDLLDEIEGEAAALLREIERGNGPLAKSLARRKAVFVWMQAVDEAVVFAVARPGRKLVVQTSPKSWMTLFQSATEQMEALAGSQELRRLIETPRDFGRSAPDRMIRRLMSQAFELLPKELKQIVSESQPNTIFVSGCRLTLDFPVELLLKPQPEGGSAFVGLHKTLVRMHSLRDLQEVLSRKTDIRTGKRIILADPDASAAGWDRLDYALETGQYLASLLADAGLPCQELYGPNATRTPALTGLLDSRLGLFVFDGHGEDGSIILAPGERIRTKDLEEGRWTHGPFIYMDCCSAGTSHGRGGGRFEGLPSACVRRGARAVVASFHPQLEEPSAVFTRNLFEGLLRGATLGDALLDTRRIVNDKYGGNPFVWATFTLWGDPSVTLKKNLKKN